MGLPPAGLRVLAARDDALLVEVADLDTARHLHRSLREDPVPGVGRPVAGARTVLVPYDPAVVGPGPLAATLRGRAIAPSSGPGARHAVVEVPTVYDGDDLPDVAHLLGRSLEEVVRRHGAATWTVAFMGFAPGFGYLEGDDPGLVVPRRATPRTRVPRGSVALAGEYSGIYPREGPGGWQLLGRTDLAVWDLDRAEPALWAPGDRVRFVAIRGVARGRDQAGDLRGTSGSDRQSGLPIRSRTADQITVRDAAVEILDAGLQSLVQDLGRPGHTDQGVTAAGAADPRSLRAAGRAVGNLPDDAAIETLGGLRIRARGHLVVAVAGAPSPLALHPADGGAPRHPTPTPTPSSPTSTPALTPAFALTPGDELAVGHPPRGLRTYLAVRGGLLATTVLGSRSTDVLGRVGPDPLTNGDRLDVGPPPGDAVATSDVGAPEAALLPAAGEVTVLPLVVGPRDDWFTPAALDSLLDQEWTVTTRSDRVGLRLDGTPLQRTVAAAGRELPSEGCVTGALQVPPDGLPVLLGPDHPVTGGYPVVGAVASTHLWLLGQLPPGSRIRFRPWSG